MTLTPPPTDLPRPWGYWATLGWVILALLMSEIVAGGILLLIHPDAIDLLTTYDGKTLALTTLIAMPIAVAMFMLLAKWKGWPPLVYLGLTVPRPRDVVLALACIAVVIAVTDVGLYLLGQDIVPPFQVEAYRSAKAAGWLVALWLAVTVAAPIGEEVMFRGFLMRGWARQRKDVPLAILLSSLGWASLHVQYDWIGIGQIFCLGLLLGWVRWRTGSITLTILMHASVNVEAMVETVIRMEWMPAAG